MREDGRATSLRYPTTVFEQPVLHCGEREKALPTSHLHSGRTAQKDMNRTSIPKQLSTTSTRKRMPRKKEKPIRRTTKGSGANYRKTKSGAGMTKKGVAAYRRKNPGSKLKTAVTGNPKKGSKDAKRRKSFCARSAGQMKKFPKAAKNPNSRLRQARKRWKC